MTKCLCCCGALFIFNNQFVKQRKDFCTTFHLKTKWTVSLACQATQVVKICNCVAWPWVIICTSVLFVVFLWIWATDHLFWHFFYDLEAQFLTLPSASFAYSALRKSLQIMIYINNLKTKYDNAAIPNMTQNIRKNELWNTPQRT